MAISKEALRDYRCRNCGATGCKLWRDGGCFVAPSPLCCDCTARASGKDVSDLREDGIRIDPLFGETEHIGWYVPCIPMDNGAGYYGVGNTPEAAVAWWKELPLRAPVPALA